MKEWDWMEGLWIVSEDGGYINKLKKDGEKIKKGKRVLEDEKGEVEEMKKVDGIWEKKRILGDIWIKDCRDWK